MVDIVIICYCYRLLLSLAYHTHYFRLIAHFDLRIQKVKRSS